MALKKSDKDVLLQLNIDEINKVIEALAKQPFMDVYKLIEKIHLQVKDNGQINSKKSYPSSLSSSFIYSYLHHIIIIIIIFIIIIFIIIIIINYHNNHHYQIINHYHYYYNYYYYI